MPPVDSAADDLTPVDARPGSLRARLRSAEPLTGLVVRTPSHQVIEVLAASPHGMVDVVMLDREHAPFAADTLDAMLAVARALRVPTLVRVEELTRSAVQQPLDLGADGVVVPHVTTPAVARRAVRLAHYGDGGRGYSGSTRSAGWGTRPMPEVLAAAAASTTVVIQVEDPVALDEIDEIVAVPGIDAVFVGAADLAVALGANAVTDDRVVAACDVVIAACRGAGVPVVAFSGSDAEAARWRSRGATLVLRGTDQSRLH